MRLGKMTEKMVGLFLRSPRVRGGFSDAIAWTERLRAQGGTGKSRRHQQSTSHGLLILPEVLEPFRRELGVSDGVLNVLVPQIVLKRPRVLTIIGELKPAGVAQHVRMD
jgi:hypothetical protein